MSWGQNFSLISHLFAHMGVVKFLWSVKVRKRQQNAAVVIQSHYRSYLCRKSLVSHWLLVVTALMCALLLQYERLSLNYERRFSQLANTNDVNTLHTVTRHLIFMCSIRMDVDKLVSVVTMVIRCILFGYHGAIHTDITMSKMVTNEASCDPKFW